MVKHYRTLDRKPSPIPMGEGRVRALLADEKSTFLSVHRFKSRPHPGPLPEYREREIVNRL
jgi:hypothetical protein